MIFRDADAKWGETLDERHKQKIMREVEQLWHANLVESMKILYHNTLKNQFDVLAYLRMQGLDIYVQQERFTQSTQIFFLNRLASTNTLFHHLNKLIQVSEVKKKENWNKIRSLKEYIVISKLHRTNNPTTLLQTHTTGSGS